MTTIRLLTGHAARPRLRPLSGMDMRVRVADGLRTGSFLGDGQSRGNAGTNEHDDGDRVCAAGDAMR